MLSRRTSSAVCVLLLGRALADAGWFRNRTCITVAPTYPPAGRRHLALGGVTGPLKIGVGDWDSNKLLAWVFKTLAEEILGVHVELELFQGSIQMLYAVGGCKDPLNHMVDPRCGLPGGPLVHIVPGAWMVGSTSLALAELASKYPEWYPIDLGSVGFGGRNGLFMKESSKTEALSRHHVPLDYYTSYTHPHPALDLGAFFDGPSNISSDDLLPCNRTDMGKHSLAARYVVLTGDHGGVTAAGGQNDTELAMECHGGPWWISPSCRADFSKCVPLITGGNGWEVEAISQRAFAWKLPVAVATAKDFATYVRLVLDLRIMFYWWFPDVTFLRISPSRMVWPPYNDREWEDSVMHSDDPTTAIKKWAYRGMENRSDEGTAKVLAALRQMTVRGQDVLELMTSYLGQLSAGDHGYEEAACEWLNDRKFKWEAWIPVDTVCLEGQGLVTAAGTFVDEREQAKTCAWCSVGRVSVPVKDRIGTTYRCEECSPGTFQPAMGKIACELCAEGTAAAQAGSSSCERCRAGHYATSPGSLRCESCLPGFKTAFLGATSVKACICEGGFYRDQNARGACLPCPFGMHCPEGSDALGYMPEHALQHPVTPLLQPGFWSSAAEPLSVFRCDGRTSCPGGRAPGNACALRLESRACAHCVDGFEWDGRECLECTSGASKYLLLPVLPMIVLPIGICLLYKVTGDEYEKWGGWKNALGAACFIVLQHYHIMNVLLRTHTAVPETVTGTFGAFAFLSDVWHAFWMGCYGFKSFSSLLVLQSLGPIFLLCAYAVTWGIAQLLGRSLLPAAKMELNRTLNGFFALIFAFFTGIADTSFTIFKCAPNPNGKYSLVKDRSILCYEGEWHGLLVIGTFAVLCWCVGVSLVFVSAILSAPKQFHRRSVQTRWKFLFLRYKPVAHWWALTFLAKGILVNLGVVFISDGMGQLFWITAMLLVYVGLLSHVRPWRHPLNSNVDLWMHCCLLANCGAMFWFAKDSSITSIPAGDRLASIMLKVSTFGLTSIILPVGCTMYWTSVSRTVRCHKEQNVELMADAIELLAMNHDDCLRFLRSLDEVDFRIMADAKDLILTEKALKRCRMGYSTKRLSTLDLDEIRGSKSNSLTSASRVNSLISAARHTTSISCELDASGATEQSDLPQETQGSDTPQRVPSRVLAFERGEDTSEESSAQPVHPRQPPDPPGCLLTIDP